MRMALLQGDCTVHLRLLWQVPGGPPPCKSGHLLHPGVEEAADNLMQSACSHRLMASPADSLRVLHRGRHAAVIQDTGPLL